MKAVILCGGQGTRIRDVADNIPKPMIQIGERPILWHIMRLYAHSGIKDFVLCLGYRSWSIKQFFLNFHPFVADVTVRLGQPDGLSYDNADFPERDWNVSLVETGLSTQTGGRLWRVRDWVRDSELFCFTYGDGVADLDVGAVVAFHRRHGKVATVTGVRPPGRFGVMTIADDGHDGARRVSDFLEKPQTGEGLINGGFFVFDQRVFDYLTEDPALVFEQEPLQQLARAGELVLYEHDGFWQPMDTYREYKLLHDLWDAGKAPWAR